MQLSRKKALAAKILKVGKDRIVFSNTNLSEIKEAITRQDMTDLHNSGAIKIKEVKGRRKIKKRKNQRRTGSIKKRVKARKQNYVKLTRKLRKYTKHALKTGRIEKEEYKETRKMIKAKKFRSKRHLNENLGDKE